MSKTKLVGLFAHVEPVRAAQLKALSQETGIPKSALVREGVDLVLMKHGKLLQTSKGRTRKG